MGSNIVRADFGSGLICPRAQTNSEWFMRTPRDAYPGAQTCMGSNMVRADFWQLTDLPPGSNMLRRAAQTCSACKLAGVQISPLPTLANQILARTFSDPSCICLRAQPLKNSAGRVPQAADGSCNKI